MNGQVIQIVDLILSNNTLWIYLYCEEQLCIAKGGIGSEGG